MSDYVAKFTSAKNRVPIWNEGRQVEWAAKAQFALATKERDLLFQPPFLSKAERPRKDRKVKKSKTSIPNPFTLPISSSSSSSSSTQVKIESKAEDALKTDFYDNEEGDVDSSNLPNVPIDGVHEFSNSDSEDSDHSKELAWLKKEVARLHGLRTAIVVHDESPARHSPFDKRAVHIFYNKDGDPETEEETEIRNSGFGKMAAAFTGNDFTLYIAPLHYGDLYQLWENLKMPLQIIAPI